MRKQENYLFFPLYITSNISKMNMLQNSRSETCFIFLTFNYSDAQQICSIQLKSIVTKVKIAHHELFLYLP